MLEQLRAYDGASREVPLTLLPLAAQVGDGGLDRATPQEAAVLLDQVRQVEALLRPRAARRSTRSASAARSTASATAEPWPPDHVFQPQNDDRRGERIQVYAEVRNFTCRPRDGVYETSLAGVVEIRDFANHVACRIDFPASVERSQTPRQDYFINFPFHLPCLPEGRYTLHVRVKDVLAPAGDDAAPRTAGRSIDFVVGGGAVRVGRDLSPSRDREGAVLAQNRSLTVAARIGRGSVSLRRPFQLLLQELERADAVDLVRPVEVLDLRPLRQLQPAVEPAHLGVFVGHHLVDAHAVVVAALHHERPRRDQGRHLRVVERVAQVELGHLVFAREHVAALEIDRGVLATHSLKSPEQIDRQ